MDTENLKMENIQSSYPVQLRMLTIATMTHKSSEFRMSLDFSYQLKIKDSFASAVNENTIHALLQEAL